MQKFLSVFLIVAALIPASMLAQQRTFLRPDGKILKVDANTKITSFDVMKMKHKPNPEITKRNPNRLDLVDTLGYNDGTFNTNFVGYGQDIMLTWFKAPADLTIKGFAVYCTDQTGFDNNGATWEGKIVSINLTEAELLAEPVHWDGYYPAAGNGFNDITAFLDNPDRTGDWVSESGDPEPFGNDIWSDGGVGAPLVPDASLLDYQWISTGLLFEPDVTGGSVFGITYKNTGVDYTTASDQLGNLSGIISVPHSWKFYANGRLINPPNPDADIGWWAREYSFDYLVEVSIYGDTPPDFNSYTAIQSGIDLGPYTIDANITDGNPGGGDMGVASASIFWTNDDGTTWNEVPMTGTEPDFTGQIPAQGAGTTVTYYLEATDVNGNTSFTINVEFTTFASSGANTLLVFNGLNGTTGYPQDYYFGSGEWPANYNFLDFLHDVWAFGPIPPEIVDNYTNIIEITSGGPLDINSDVIRTWLEGSGDRNYMLAGDEWLGTQTGWVDSVYEAGSFQYDILGIQADHNDVNYAASGDQNLASVVHPQQGTMLGGPLYDLYEATLSDSGWTADMHYDPFYEISIANWMDGVDFLGDVEVDMTGIGIDLTEYNIGGHRTLPDGNKIVFLTYDPLSLNSDAGGPEYFWYGFMDVAPQVEGLTWFGYVSDVQPTGGNAPESFSLSQNYPNPFNPSTSIKFSVPKTSKVVLKVFDVLGREVTTLVNQEMTSGNYEVAFNASKLASGMYIYTMNAGDFSVSKKMVLLK